MKSRHLFENQQDFLVMRITGTYNYWEFIHFPTLLRKKCETLSRYKVLVDLLKVRYSEPTTLELFMLGEKLAEELRNCTKIAFLLNRKFHALFPSEVPGIGAVASFDSTLKAKQWLNNDRKSPFLKTRREGDFQL